MRTYTVYLLINEIFIGTTLTAKCAVTWTATIPCLCILQACCWHSYSYLTIEM